MKPTTPWALLAAVIGIVAGGRLLDEPMPAKVALGAAVTETPGRPA